MTQATTQAEQDNDPCPYFGPEGIDSPERWYNRNWIFDIENETEAPEVDEDGQVE